MMRSITSSKFLQKYESILRNALVSVAFIESFANFLNQGIDHMRSAVQAESDHDMEEEDRTEVSRKKVSSSQSKAQQLQRLRDISSALQALHAGLKTGLNDGDDLFSTDAEDYTSNSGSTSSGS